MQELWTPGGYVTPTKGKAEGGSYFDDEMETQAEHSAKFWQEMARLADHINKRPDHTVFVGSAESRGQLRAVFNSWREQGMIAAVPTIKIDYGVEEGQIRIDEDRRS